MAEPEVIWQDGDKWRDLAGDIRAAGSATVVSLRATTRLLDVANGRQLRVPSSAAHVMDLDLQWVSLGNWAITPCGLAIDAAEYWAGGTPLRLVLAGLVPDWPSTEVGRSVLDALRAGREPVAPGHPEGPCDAAYCPNGPIEAWRRLRRANVQRQGREETGER